MAEDAPAGQEPVHHGIRFWRILMTAKNSLHLFGFCADAAQKEFRRALAINETSQRNQYELRLSSHDREIVPHEANRQRIERVLRFEIAESGDSFGRRVCACKPVRVLRQIL